MNVAMLGLKGFLNQCKTCNLMKKTEKVWPTCTKEFVRKLFQPTFPMAFLFHLTVSFIWRVRHVWHWLNGRWLCVCVCLVGWCCCFLPQLCPLARSSSLRLCNLQNNQIVSKNESVKRLRASCSIIHNFMSSKCWIHLHHANTLRTQSMRILSNTNTILSGQKVIHRKWTFAPSSSSLCH